MPLYGAGIALILTGAAPIDGRCPQQGMAANGKPEAICAAGTPSDVSAVGNGWSWTCQGSAGGADQICHLVSWQLWDRK